MTKKTGKTKTHLKTNEKIINKQKAAEHAWMQGDGVGNTLIQIVLQKKKRRQSTRGCKEMEWEPRP
jgi:uncharacterized protein YhfF